ncbi:uncharacterized protein LOC128668518 [Microplitis demolitor]|uniref:uncharacterized protein LOC128668518 n=1 Tax=Microplitis demolitor TaxID=69319 RepID=UPI00235B64BA|nr:uncharacterized protein LOC128668518 [Microplitis demolitor]
MKNVIEAINLVLVGKFPPQLLSPKRIFEAMETFLNKNPQYRIPIETEDLYNEEASKLMKFKHKFYKDNLILTLRLPLVQLLEYNLYKLHPYPVRQIFGNNSKGSAYIQPRSDYLMMPSNHEWYTLVQEDELKQCQDLRNLYICKPNFVIYETAIHPSCEADLFANSRLDSFSRCDIRLSKTHYLFWKSLKEIKGWIYSMPHLSLLQVSRHGSSTEYIKISGMRTLTLSPGYSARIGYTTLYGSEDSTALLQPQPKIGLNITQLFPEIHKYRPLSSVNYNDDSPTPVSLIDSYGFLSYDYTLKQIEQELQLIEPIRTHEDL